MKPVIYITPEGRIDFRDNGVDIPFEDQAQIKAIIKAMIGHDLDLMTIDTTGYEYPFPSDQYKVEIKTLLFTDTGEWVDFSEWLKVVGLKTIYVDKDRTKQVAVLSPLKPQEDKLIKLTLEQMYDFVQWYSGMDRLKIMAAYTRYLKESTKRG